MTSPSSWEGPSDWEGYITHTTARTTKTLVVLVDTEGQGLSVEDGGKYSLICDPHGGLLQSENKVTALYYMRHPEEWCPDCMDDRGPLG